MAGPLRSSPATTLILVALLTGCGSASAPTASGTSTHAPPASTTAGPDCTPIDLRSPGGHPLDLTGTWETGSRVAGDLRILQVRQIGRCVYWWGENAFPERYGQPAHQYNVFRGVLDTDFSLVGQWVEVPGTTYQGHAITELDYGTLSLRVRFSGSGLDATPELELTSELVRFPDTQGTRAQGTVWRQTIDAKGKPITKPLT